MTYVPAENRYETMVYRRCGNSGLKLPAISLGLWHNFGHDTPHDTKRAIVQTAFDHGITAAFALADGPLTLDEALSRCGELLSDRARTLARLWQVAPR